MAPHKTFTHRALAGPAHEYKMARPFAIQYPDKQIYVDSSGWCWILPNHLLGHVRKILPEVASDSKKSMRRV